ncbi:amidase [Oceanibacterium hippocampi]|uniref:6-aminohexanoate-cyclic-dimer hydrolase n=1 Tax=Oceanibacterium hippocampi TaxID=745714 RepID=A0A1Y5TGA2_9PROT|nr:amidase [Oceanibacterium hippocampi]SLN63409.1 6-aminohexanoate-cyclic-dimer hydrolase [Oceanibacterium hippocampi]
MAVIDEYDDHDALGLAALVASGKVTPGELLETAITRAETVEPAINAISYRHDDLAREAVAAGLPDGPFRGVPFLLKNVGVQLAGTVTSGGSALFSDAVADHDSDVVQRYKAAGLVIFGKTNTPEQGLAASTETVLHGDTRNPWDLTRTAGGSSGGAAAAVAAGIVPAAQGSDGGGSIRIPASCCGLFGLKPTRGRVSLGPDAGESWGGLGVVHALTRSVRDSAALLDAVAGRIPGDPYSAQPPARPYRKEVGADPGKLKVALQLAPLSGTPVDPECVTAAREAAQLLESLGHHVEEAMPPGDGEEVGGAVWTLVAANVLSALRRRATHLGRELAESDVEPVTWNAVVHARTLTADAYADALSVIHAQGRRMAAFHRDNDILVSPTLAEPPAPLGPQRMRNPDIEEYSAALLRFSPFTSLFNVSGQPSMSVPLHWSADGLPVGVMMSATMENEGLLFRLAAQLETAKPWFHRRPPASPPGTV